MTADLNPVLERLWERFAPVVQGRVALLEAYADGLLRGDDPAGPRAECARTAHQLAGSLGSYGRGGSVEAARLQDLLEGDGPRDEVPGLVRRLRAHVGGAVQSRSWPAT